MKSYTKTEIIEIIESEDIIFINLQFTDLYGNLKEITVSTSRIDKILNNKCSIRKSAVYDINDGEATHFFLKPILSTFCVLPWRPQQGKVARLICDICDIYGNDFQDSPRYILQRAIQHASKMGYQIQTNLMCRFFLFDTDDKGLPLDKTSDSAGYLGANSNDFGLNYRRDLSLTMENMGYEIEALFHESAPAQQEIDFPFGLPLETADKFVTFKLVADSIAKRHGVCAVFMPKPKEDFNGSYMHLRISLLKNGRNVFENEHGDFNSVGKFFVAGILTHIRSMTVFCNPIVNSYKRLNFDYDAPSEIVWSTNYEKALILVQKDSDAGIIIEVRSPDSSCNPYILIAGCIEAGLDGIQKQLNISSEVNENIFNLTEVEKEKMNLEKLPSNLSEALNIMVTDPWIKDIFGETFVKKYKFHKEEEWYSYQKHISEWEIKKYLRPM